MKSKRIQVRIPEDWAPRMQDVAMRAGYGNFNERGTANSISNWLRSIIAREIGESETVSYHEFKEELARSVHEQLSNFREIFTRYANPDASPLHRATYELGCLVQDLPQEHWGKLLDDSPSWFEYGDEKWMKESVPELLLRTVTHAVNHIAFGDVRIGGGRDTPRQKAQNLYPKLVANHGRRQQEGLPFSWADKALYAGQALCRALKEDGKTQNRESAECEDLVQRARASLA